LSTWPRRRPGPPPGLTKDERKALQEYGQSRGYRVVNPYLNSNGQVFDKDIKALRPATPAEAEYAATMIAGLDGAFARAEPLPRAITVSRGTGDVDKLFGAPGSKVGKKFTSLSYMSTTVAEGGKPGHGYDYESKPGRLTITVPAGSKVVPGNAHEGEVILPRNGSFRVLSDAEGPGGGRDIHLEYLPPKMTLAQRKKNAKAAVTGDDAYARISTPDDLAPADANALLDYQGKGYRAINGHLEGDAPGKDSKDAAQRAAAVAGAMRGSVVTGPVTLARGISPDATAKVFGDPGSKTGKVLTEKRFVSTSVTETTARSFAGEDSGATLWYHLDAGDPGLAMNKTLGSKSKYPDEDEVLLPAGRKWRVTQDTAGSGGKPREIHLYPA
jgi:hypothetical protein